jgi:hypothetical protein
MKRSGARWKEATAADVINLRALALSDRWVPLFSSRLHHYESRSAVLRDHNGTVCPQSGPLKGPAVDVVGLDDSLGS